MGGWSLWLLGKLFSFIDMIMSLSFREATKKTGKKVHNSCELSPKMENPPLPLFHKYFSHFQNLKINVFFAIIKSLWIWFCKPEIQLTIKLSTHSHSLFDASKQEYWLLFNSRPPCLAKLHQHNSLSHYFVVKYCDWLIHIQCEVV